MAIKEAGKHAERPVGYLIRRGIDYAIEVVLCAVSTLALRLKCFWSGVRCGKGVKAYGQVILRAPAGNVEIGNATIFVSSSWRCSSSALSHPVKLRTFSPKARIVIGARAGLNGTSITARSCRIFIGNDVMIGPDSLIMDSDFHSIWPPESRNVYDESQDADVVIEPNVWLGARCIVLKGSQIGENSVIAAGSLVCGVIPPNVLAAGAPAKIVKSLK